ncbi:MAG: glycosyltransferase family 39 protein [Chloroflexota bacterium]|nr:MAG: glycosyltransferase family 39 protein [Chloroflexota bacterium]
MQEEKRRARRRALSRNILVLITYAVLAIVMTWPIAGRLGTHIPGSESDVWVHLWTARWVRDALFGEPSLFHSDIIFYPQGTPLTTHNIAWVNIAMWLPLQLVAGEAAAYSLMMLAVLVLNGFAIYLLARDLIQSEGAAFVAGLIGAFWPFILSHHNSPNLSLIAWVPLAMLYLKRTVEQQRLKDALLTAVFVALIGISRWQMLTLSAPLIALFFGYLIVMYPERRTRRTAGLTLLAVFAAFLIMLPFLLPPAMDQITRADPEEIFTDDGKQTDLLAYIVPSRFHPWWGKVVFERFYGNFTINQFSVTFVGYTVLILALVAVLKRWRQARFWLLVTLIYILLALGPELLFNGQGIAPLPYRWVDDFFFIRIIRNPDRFNAILVVPAAMLAGLGVAAIQQNPRLSRRSATLVVVAIAIFILFEYIARTPTFAMDVPDWYHQLALEEGDFAILDLPMQRRVADENYMHYQFEHGKALVGGKVARPPAEAFAFIESLPLLQAVNRGPLPPEDITRFSDQFAQLDEADVRYLVMHKRRFKGEQLPAWREWLDLPPVYEDDILVVYRTDWQLSRDMVADETGIPGLGLVSADVGPPSIAQDGWVTIDARWGSETGLDQDYDVCFQISGPGSNLEREFCHPLSPEWPTGRWEANEVVDVSYSLNFDPYLESGEYAVTAVVVPEGKKEPVSDPLTMGQVAFTAVERVFAGEDEFLPGDIQATFGEEISLIDYALRQADGDMMEVTLRWLTLERMDEFYKFFVHILDPVTGEVVSQVDTAPRDWGYPTTWWEAGEIVTDSVQLSLADLSPGEYEVTIGLYDGGTGERLPITARSDESQAGGVLHLTMIQR